MEFRPRIHDRNDFSVFFFLLLLSTIAITAYASIHIYNNQTFREVSNFYLFSSGSEGIVASLTTTTTMTRRRSTMAGRILGIIVIFGLLLCISIGFRVRFLPDLFSSS
ncbi:hypothetical protein PanWU01x14_227470 [Parasponia andersonii]|uniref:Uncharacterized protein n=1 Tax=Parasponia andersonii TaxID=3476 RepID=A0A2P5BM35_PARAD|nr:hypothetical protein PanWU01x14_227470 [Parasponia andersonii]